MKKAAVFRKEDSRFLVGKVLKKTVVVYKYIIYFIKFSSRHGKEK